MVKDQEYLEKKASYCLDLAKKLGVSAIIQPGGSINDNTIIEVANKCKFFVYSGHGSTMGVNGNAGGICINSMVSSYELIKSLRLKENALVIFKSVCRGAGSSAGDNTDIGITEAKKRVTNYAYPFFEIGASAYYANNYGAGAYNFLEDFLVSMGGRYDFTIDKIVFDVPTLKILLKKRV